MRRRRNALGLALKRAGAGARGGRRAAAGHTGTRRGLVVRGGTTAILVAAGSGRRLGRKTDKVFVRIGGRPLLLYALEALQRSPEIRRVVVVVRRSALGACQTLARRGSLTKVEAIVGGGRRRQDSVRNGLRFAGHCEYVLVHDAARPFLSQRLITSTLAACRRTGAAISAEPVSDTVKQVRSGLVTRTIPRETLWLAQTPQAFRRELLERAFEKWPERRDATDDASLLEGASTKIAVVRGDSFNIKITYPQDILLAESLLKEWKKLSRRREHS